MNETLHLGNNQGFDEFSYGDALRLADNNKSLMNLGVQLGPHVLTVETHAAALRLRWNSGQLG